MRVYRAPRCAHQSHQARRGPVPSSSGPAAPSLEVPGDEPTNGDRYVTHRRLAEVMDQHRTVEVPAIQARYDARLDRKANVDRVERNERDIMDLRRDVANHDDVIQQMRGMVSLARIALGSSIIAAIVSLVAIVDAIR